MRETGSTPVEPRDFPHFVRRLRWFLAVLILFFLIAVAKLAHMTLVKGEEYAVEADRILWRHPSIEAPRGLIIDRDGEALASNRIVYDVIYSRGGMSRRESMTAIEALADFFPETTDRWLTILEDGRRLSRRPHTLARGMTLAEVTPVMERLDQFPGVTIRERFERHYPVQGLALGHVLGYVREVDVASFRAHLRRLGGDPDSIDWESMGNLTNFANLLAQYGYALGDAIGVRGLELMQENHLRGEKGRERNIHNVYGQVLGETIARPASPGLTAQLTLDLDLQRVAAELMGDQPGALIAMEPHTGAILAMISSPGFDSDQPMTGRDWAATVRDPLRRLYNRATRDVYNPGSTLKPMVALGALRDGVVDEETRFYCDGTHEIGEYTFRCDYEWGCEWMNVRSALRRSCNTYFYQTATRMGQSGWLRTCREFGLFQPTGIDLPGESRGHQPRANVYPGELVQLGIGQGPFDTTPLQMVNAYARLCTNNRAVTPHVLERLLDIEGNTVWQREEPTPITPVIASMEPSHLRIVINGLRDVARTGVPYEQRGTATRTNFPAEWDVAGKTGTAENRGLIDSWFIGFAPASAPEIVVGCVIEGGGHGADTAAPIVRELMRAHFDPETQAEVQSSESD